VTVSLLDWYRVYHAEKERLLAQYASVKTAKILAATRANMALKTTEA
jgi:hypothetical protein